MEEQTVNTTIAVEEQKQEKKTARDRYVDIAKGIAIIFVIVGHTVAPGSFFDLFSFSFHMPLFFIVAGFFVSIKKYTFGQFLCKKALRLLAPLLVYILICFFVTNINGIAELSWNFLYSSGAISPSMQNVFSPVPWFLQCLFVSSAIFFLLLKLKEKCKINDWYFLLIMIFISAIGFCLTGFGCYKIAWIPYLPFSLDLAVFSQLFLYIGFLMNKYKLFAKINGKITLVIVGISLVVWVVALCLIGTVPKNYLIISMNDRVISPTSTVVAIAGSIVVIYIAKLIEKVRFLNAFFAYLGQISLVIYLFHLFPFVFGFFNISADSINAVLCILLRLAQTIILTEIFRILPGINYVLGLKPYKFEQRLWNKSLGKGN